MNQFEDYISVGKKKGEWDFQVGAIICNLSHQEMKDLREMIVVAIGTAELMWRNAQERKHPSAKNDI